ncbi:MAG: 2-dehydropantoate 2-reductase, partial [Burkholderiales bacterium]|nr:2-dehydropantoate 2-reductase [Burkholderiales bacterium]
MKVPMPGPVLVMGAGSVGCFIGGRLQAAGAQVRFVGRPRVLDGLRAQGLALT